MTSQTQAPTPSRSSNEPDAPVSPRTPRGSGVVIVVGLILVIGFAVLALQTLTTVPDQRRLMTPVESDAPPWAADVEARVAAVNSAASARGESLFTMYACAGCHHASDDGAGPPLTGMGARAATRREHYSAAAYLYESIAEPNAFVVPGYAAGVMMQNFGSQIPQEDLDTLIAWLLSR